MSRPSGDTELRFQDGLWHGHFTCMASPCELLIETDQQLAAEGYLHLVASEARRIETKFSRYRDDNIVHEINSSAGKEVLVDEETGMLLDFSAQCYQLSDGLFDVTSGVLRRAWHFDCSDRLAEQDAIRAVLPFLGWNKVSWKKPRLKMSEGMEIDLGGVGKEYAVDRAFDRLRRQTNVPFLINFGGDLRVSGARLDGSAWRVGVENPVYIGGSAEATIEISSGALATSGDSRRFLLKEGKRYSHILNPKTGWPIEDAPRSVTVAGPTAIEAGMLATMASLQGTDAEAFLESQEVKYWLIR